MNRIIATLIALAAFLPATWAQEYCFSQYYLDYAAISPAYVSVGRGADVSLAIRSQWPGINGGYKIYKAEARAKLESISSGIGARIMGNTSGGGAFSTTCASLMYGYDFHITYGLKCSIGIEGAYNNRSLHTGNLVYYSMLDPATGQVSGSGAPVDKQAAHSLGFSMGTVFYTKNTLMALGLCRLNNIAIAGQTNRMPMQVNANISHRIILQGYPGKNETALYPGIILSHSSISDIIMPGVYFAGHKLLLSLAFKYTRGDCASGAVVTSVGIDLGSISLSIGHDFDTSPISGGAYGATEAGIRLNFENIKKNNGSKTIMCPAF